MDDLTGDEELLTWLSKVRLTLMEDIIKDINEDLFGDKPEDKPEDEPEFVPAVLPIRSRWRRLKFWNWRLRLKEDES